MQMQRLMCRASFLVAIGCALAFSVPTMAAGEEEERFYIAIDDQSAISITQPAGWRPALSRDAGIGTEDGARLYVHITDRHYSDTPPSIESARAVYRDYQAKYWEKNREKCRLKRFEEATFLGLSGIFVERGSCYELDGDDPIEFRFEALADHYRRVSIYYLVEELHALKQEGTEGDKYALYARHRDAALEAAQSAELVARVDLSPDARVFTEYVGTPVRVSKRLGYSLEAYMDFFHPDDWLPMIASSRTASDEDPNGGFVVEVGLYDEDDPFDPHAVVLLSVSGLRPGPITVPEFLRTTGALIEERFGAAPVEHASQQEEFTAFWCLANFAIRRGESTGKTYVRTYSVEDGEGREWSLKAYTAGGMTAAANLIVAAAPDEFDGILAEVAPLIDSLRMVVRGPTIQPFGTCGG